MFAPHRVLALARKELVQTSRDPVSLFVLLGMPAALLMSMILFSALIFMAGIGSMFQLYWSVALRKEDTAGARTEQDGEA